MHKTQCSNFSLTFATIGTPSKLSVGSYQGGSEIKPRRRDGTRPGSVMITLDVITRLQDYPLGEAASRLGISATAFKKACRKLGLQRWTYTKHGSRNSLGKIASQMIMPTSAYAKHILRKYTSCSRNRKGSISESQERKVGKSKTVERTAPGTEASQVSNPEQIDDFLEIDVKNVLSKWAGPHDGFISPLTFSDAEQIFAEELMPDDECALAMLASVWKQSSFHALDH